MKLNHLLVVVQFATLSDFAQCKHSHLNRYLTSNVLSELEEDDFTQPLTTYVPSKSYNQLQLYKNMNHHNKHKRKHHKHLFKESQLVANEKKMRHKHKDVKPSDPKQNEQMKSDESNNSFKQQNKQQDQKPTNQAQTQQKQKDQIQNFQAKDKSKQTQQKDNDQLNKDKSKDQNKNQLKDTQESKDQKSQEQSKSNQSEQGKNKNSDQQKDKKEDKQKESKDQKDQQKNEKKDQKKDENKDQKTGEKQKEQPKKPEAKPLNCTCIDGKKYYKFLKLVSSNKGVDKADAGIVDLYLNIVKTISMKNLKEEERKEKAGFYDKKPVKKPDPNSKDPAAQQQGSGEGGAPTIADLEEEEGGPPNPLQEDLESDKDMDDLNQVEKEVEAEGEMDDNGDIKPKKKLSLATLAKQKKYEDLIQREAKKVSLWDGNVHKGDGDGKPTSKYDFYKKCACE